MEPLPPLTRQARPVNKLTNQRRMFPTLEALRFHVVAVAFDGTLETNGQVPDSTVAALETLRASHRRLMLVSGRAPDDLQGAFPRIDLFDRVVPDADGLQAALDDLALSPRNTVGIAAATDDLPFLKLCECAVAVAN